MTTTGSTLTAHYLRSRMSRVCVAITGASTPEMIEKAEAVARENSFLEFRLDFLDKPLAAIPVFRDFLYERSDITAVATCRRVNAGGKFKGSPTAELEILTQAAAAGFHLIDLEIETAEAVSVAQYAALRGVSVGLILSSHDFDGTKDLDKTFVRLKAYSPDFYKIVSTAKNLSDNVEMKRFLERTSDSANVIGICMGDQGLISRVLGVRAGSVFTFASAHAGEETAPGQIAARTLIETYRIDQIDAATRVYGVAGNPIRHSLSPVMMNSAFRRETVNGVFLALETRKLSDLLKVVQAAPIQGLAITMPLKQEILPYLAKTDAISEKIGACNTIVRAQDGRLFGFNTDVGGIVRPLERRLQLRGSRVLVLGAGGAARAAVFGLVEKGAEVTILNRTVETAQKLARQAKAKTIKRELVAKTTFDVILNATPAGMTGQKLQMILHPDELNARIVFDTVYNPIDTPLIRAAREKGIAVITGVEMFVQQGARQFEIWTGKPAPEEEMLRVALHALRRRAEAGAPALGPQIVTPSVTHKPANSVFANSTVVPAASAKPTPAPPLSPSKAAGTNSNKLGTKVAAATSHGNEAKAKSTVAVSRNPAPEKATATKPSAKMVPSKSTAKPAAKPVPRKTPGKAAAPPIRARGAAKSPVKTHSNGNRASVVSSKPAKSGSAGKVPKALLAIAAKSKKSATKR